MKLLQVTMAFAALVVASIDAEGVRERKQYRDLEELRRYAQEDTADQSQDDPNQDIIGGTQVVTDLFPFHARYTDGLNNFCGGAFIDTGDAVTGAKVLTTASCVKAFYGTTTLAEGETVNIGARDSVSNIGVNFTIANATFHPFFDDAVSPPLYDVAILEMTENSLLISSISPITGTARADYPSDTVLFPSPELMFLGFGSTDGLDNPSTFLSNITLPFVDSTSCNSQVTGTVDSSLHLCAGGGAALEGSCFGDPGGMLIGVGIGNGVPDVYTLVGLLSWPALDGLPGCGTSTKPDVFTFVSEDSIINFIADELTTVAPTRAPTPAPTAAPTTGAAFCFSGDTTVQAMLGEDETPQSVELKDLQIGQQVFAGHDEQDKPIYETVYGFAHRDVDKVAEFLQITTSCDDQTKCDKDLKISHHHLIFKEGQNDPVVAESLSVGDVLLRQSVGEKEPRRAVITAIESIMDYGVYSPLTKDGTVIVNGIHASAYVSVSSFAPRVVDTFKQVISEQAFMHWWTAPYRVFCTRVSPQLCVDDYDEKDGYIYWYVLGRFLGETFEKVSTIGIVAGLSFIISLDGLVILLENLLERPLFWLMQLACGYVMWSRFRSMKKMVSSLKASSEKVA